MLQTELSAKPMVRERLASEWASLLVRPVRHECEGPLEHALRLAWANGLSDVRWLVDGGLPRRLRHCTTCLRESQRWRGEWNNGDSLFCAVHHAWLRERCHACGLSLRLGRVELLRCLCGADLRDAPVCQTSAAFLAITSSCDRPGDDVLMWLGSWSRFGPKGKPLKKASVAGVMERASLLEAGAEIVQTWPAAWFAAMEQHRCPVDPDQVQRVGEAWPGLPVQVRRLPDAGWRDRVWATVDEFVGRSHGTARPLVGRNPLLTRRTETQKEVAEALGIGVTRLQSMLAEVASGAACDRADRPADVGSGNSTEGKGHGAASIRRGAGGRVRRVIAPALVASLARTLTAWVSIRAAAGILGCGRARVSDLVEAGLARMERGKLPRAQVEALRDRVLGLTRGQRVQSIEWAPMARAWQMLVPAASTGCFLAAIETGRIRVWAPSDVTNWRGVMVSVPDVRAWWKAEREKVQETLSLRQAALVLGVKEQVAYELADRGLLETTSLHVGRRAARRVSLDGILAFQSRYIALSSLTALAGVRGHAALAWARARGLRLISGPRVDGARQYFAELPPPDPRASGVGSAASRPD